MSLPTSPALAEPAPTLRLRDQTDYLRLLATRIAGTSANQMLMVALICGNVQEEHFNDAHLFDPAIRALTRRIKVKPSTEADKHMPHAMRCYFKLITRSGAQFSTVVDHHKGHWKNPMNDADIEKKFRTLARKVLPEAKIDVLLARLWQLETAVDAGEVLRLTVR